MKNKGVMISLAVILTVGIMITKGTHSFVKRSLAEATSMDSAVSQEQIYEMERLDAVEEGTLAEPAPGYGKAFGGQAASTPESISPLDPAPMAEDAADDTGTDSGERGMLLDEEASPYKKRLLDLDAQIQKNRDSQTISNGNNSAKSEASNELKLWDSELNGIYNDILDRLDREGSEKLVEAQRTWLKERDNLAMEAARNSAGGSRESVDYTASLTESTRQRAYELVELYADVLEP